MTISSEVLPEPLGPTMATDSPGATSRSTRFRISTGPARLASVSDTLSRAMTGLATIAMRLPARGLASSFASFYVSTAGTESWTRSDTDADSAIEREAWQTWCFAFSSAIGCLPRSHRRRRRPPAGQPLRIVVFGDSLVAGFQLKASDAFPAQLERALKARGHAVEVINAGVSGDTTAGGLERLRWAVPERTDAVILELGANDALRGLDPTAPRPTWTR